MDTEPNFSGVNSVIEAEEVSLLGVIEYAMRDTSAQRRTQRDDEAQETFLVSEWPSLSGLAGG